MMQPNSSTRRTPRKPSLVDALIPLAFLVLSLGSAIVIYRDDAIGGPVQVALFLSATVAAQVGYRNGHSVFNMAKRPSTASLPQWAPS